MTRRWSAIALFAGALAGLVGAGYYWLMRRPLPQTSGALRLKGLREPVEIIRDRWGVPHIYARNARDLMFAQGFVHAQDRLWQMDFQRRLAAGRLAEVLGQTALPLDRWVRILGMRRVAEQEAGLVQPPMRDELEAYAAGVNARIAQGRLPVEFTLLGYTPEAWSMADSLAWIKVMSWGLSVNWEAELLRARLIERLGPERAAELEPDYLERFPYIIPPGADYAGIGQTALERARAARPFLGPSAQEGLGSNNWVIAGSRTTTGMPLLANDMHLPINLPCIWYENHLCAAGELNVTGVTFPGIPGVVAGHNERVAWGFTNGFPDVQDLYMERLRRAEDGRVLYEYTGQWLEAQVIQETIRVKNDQAVTQEVIVTHHGPIINALFPDFPEQPLALRWTSLDPDTMIYALHRMNRARNCLEFRQALRDWRAPIQNTVYADVEGNIGYSFPGKLPIRAQGNGRTPAPGWTGEYEWTGYVPFEELPHLYNPPQGYIATANNRVTGDDYPYFIGYDHCMGDRAQRIVELIEARDKLDVAYMQRMQLDVFSPTGKIVAGYVGQLETDDAELRAVVERMKTWDGVLSADSPQASIYEVLMQRAIGLALADKLGELTPRYAGKGPTPVLAEGSIFGDRAFEWLSKTLAKPNSPWFDLGRGETRDDVLRLALRETVNILKLKLGPAVDDWAWGKLHTLTFGHTLGSVRPLDRLFNRGPYPIGGDANTIRAAGFGHRDLSAPRPVGGAALVGPPYRFLVDLGDLTRSVCVLAPGQAGQPGSRHYDDQARAWLDGQYRPMLFARQDVEREAEATLWLHPAA